ncbi:MAG: aminotransferase class I/II-fold pyridoxal phosphate-dependent enzyme [Phycisphaerales bacterium]|nr:aminotransferase class I/II-fold pyridoxal phosphate-dependent enzyme [Phycisphaerales bacterium]
MDVRFPIDLRSDTVTRPTPGMRKTMAEAEVGDDVFGDDPTVNRLQERIAHMTGKEAALFVPSGSMGNQASIRAHTEPGDEIIGHEHSHFYFYEGGAPCALSGCSLRLLRGEGGMFTADDVRGALRPGNSHFPQSRLVVIENTHNKGGGTIWSLDAIRRIHEVAREAKLRMHLDGARLWNAGVATGIKIEDWARPFDTVSMCFSKGLGAPVGSIVAGSAEIIRRVHRFRKMFGGGMRQAGILAAAALYALDHHVERLADDHHNARRLAQIISALPGIQVDPRRVQTNIVFFDVDAAMSTAATLCEALKARGVWVLPVGPQTVRAVTHLDVSAEQIDAAGQVMSEVLHGRLAVA